MLVLILLVLSPPKAIPILACGTGSTILLGNATRRPEEARRTKALLLVVGRVDDGL